MAPLDGVVTRTTKGARPTTRVKRKGALWYDPTFQNAPFHPDDVPELTLWTKRHNQTAIRALFRKAANLWTTLTPTAKDCWCIRARAAGAKCGCFDFFMRSLLTTFISTGSFDSATLLCCLTPVINYTTQQMTLSQTQSLSVTPDPFAPYTWQIISGGGSLSKTTGTAVIYTAPSSNPNCGLNPTIKVTNICKKTNTLKIAINAVQGLAIWSNEFNGTYPNAAPGCAGTVWRGRRINCDGTYGPDIGICSACNCVPTGQCIQDPTCSSPIIQKTCCVYANNCWGWLHNHPTCGTCPCCEAYGDVRTPALIAAGCCPQQMFSPIFYPPF